MAGTKKTPEKPGAGLPERGRLFTGPKQPLSKMQQQWRRYHLISAEEAKKRGRFDVAVDHFLRANELQGAEIYLDWLMRTKGEDFVSNGQQELTRTINRLQKHGTEGQEAAKRLLETFRNLLKKTSQK